MVRHPLFICVFPVFSTEVHVPDNKGFWCRRPDSLEKELRHKRLTILWKDTLTGITSVVIKPRYCSVRNNLNNHYAKWTHPKHKYSWKIYINSLRKNLKACHGRKICFQPVFMFKGPQSLRGYQWHHLREEALPDNLWPCTAVSYRNSQANWVCGRQWHKNGQHSHVKKPHSVTRKT